MSKKGFLACICVLSVLTMGIIVVHAETFVDGWSNAEKEDCSKIESKGESISIGWGEDEVGDISVSEMAEMDNIPEEIVEDFSTNVRTNPATGERLSREEITQ